MHDQDLLEQISRKLSALIALTLSKDVQSLKTSDRVKILARLGLSNQTLADVLGVSKQTIEVIKSRVKRKGKDGFYAQ